MRRGRGKSWGALQGCRTVRMCWGGMGELGEKDFMWVRAVIGGMCYSLDLDTFEYKLSSKSFPSFSEKTSCLEMDSPLFFSNCCKYFFLMTRELTRLMSLRIVPCIHEIIDWLLNIQRERKISAVFCSKEGELGHKSMSELLKNMYKNYIAGVGLGPKSLMSNNFVLLWNCITCAPYHVPGDQCRKAIQQKC